MVLSLCDVTVMFVWYIRGVEGERVLTSVLIFGSQPNILSLVFTTYL